MVLWKSLWVEIIIAMKPEWCMHASELLLSLLYYPTTLFISISIFICINYHSFPYPIQSPLPPAPASLAFQSIQNLSIFTQPLIAWLIFLQGRTVDCMAMWLGDQCFQAGKKLSEVSAAVQKQTEFLVSKQNECCMYRSQPQYEHPYSIAISPRIPI